MKPFITAALFPRQYPVRIVPWARVPLLVQQRAPLSGSGNNQVVEGAILGAVPGTIAGAIIANQRQPVHVVKH